jgi:hypothetical protein
MPGDQAYHVSSSGHNTSAVSDFAQVEDLCLVGDLVVIGYGRQDPQVNHPSEQVRMFSFENITENVCSFILVTHSPLKLGHVATSNMGICRTPPS